MSWSLAKVIGRLGAQLPFEKARQNLETDLNVSKHLVEQVCEGAGSAVLEREDAERRRSQQLPRAELFPELPDSPFSPEKACIYADGAMLHTAGDWHEICVASASYSTRRMSDCAAKIARDFSRAMISAGSCFCWRGAWAIIVRGCGRTSATARDGCRN